MSEAVMFNKIYSVSIILAIFVVLSGCSGGDPTGPPLAIDDNRPENSAVRSGHALWGLYDITCDPLTGEIDAIPLRSAEFNANVTRFLQPPIAPIDLVTITLELGSDIPNGLWVIDITLRHPFMQHSVFRGFDVRGIIMSEGTETGWYDLSATYHDVGQTHLLNPDGYTRWWNPIEFADFGNIFGYTEGAKAIPGNFVSSTINPYKLFSDALNETAPVNSIDQFSRATYAPFPGSNTRRYQIQFDLDGGSPSIRFKYAIDASWSLPDPSFAPDYPVEAYDLSANCQEPYLVAVPMFEEIPYFENENVRGGDATFFLTIGDWQAVAGGSVLDQLSHIWVESPTMRDDFIDVLPTAEFVSANGDTQETYRVTFPNCRPTGLFDQRLLITAESKFPDLYAPIVDDPPEYTIPAVALAAYAIVDVPISPEGPPPQDEYFVVGFPDWCSLTEHCTNGADNLILVENLITIDLDGPYNDNATVQWWSGHVTPFPPYSTSIFANLVQSLGYIFEHSSEPMFDATDCRMVLVNFVTSPGGSSLPFTEDEVHDMKLFVQQGGVLAFLIENPTYCDYTQFDSLMFQLGVPLMFGGPAEPPSDTVMATDITPHDLTTGVSTYQYWTCGEFTLNSPDCVSLVRTPSGETIVCTAPIRVD